MPLRVNTGNALTAAAAAALLVAIFLDWFEPSLSGWTAFEIVDLLLAAIAIGALVATLGGFAGAPRAAAVAARWLPVASVVALVLVAEALINHPPAGVGRGLEVGAWIALAAALLLVGGVALSTTEISLVISRRESEPGAGDVAPPSSAPGWSPPSEPPAPEAGETEPIPPATEPTEREPPD